MQEEIQEQNNQEDQQQQQKVETQLLQILEREQTITYVSDIKQVVKPQLLTWKYNEKEDIVKNVYEGGFKLWECTIDLLQYFYKNQNNEKQVNFTGKSVIDLGCGHGLLGIYALQENASCVVFQDYNKEVLDMVTQKNIELNFSDNQEAAKKVVFLSGEWNNIPQKIQRGENELDFNEKLQAYPQKFDILLLSEVIYNTDNYKKISDLMINLLQPGGIAILANKLFYFGCGGSMPEYTEFLEQNYISSLVWESAEFINNKKGNKREIFAVKLKQ